MLVFYKGTGDWEGSGESLRVRGPHVTQHQVTVTPCPVCPADYTEPVHFLNASEFPVGITPQLNLFFQRVFTE